MADIRSLERTLADNVDWHKARINFLAKFLIALIQVCSVNLTEIAAVFPGRVKEASHYKRIQRFLRFFEISYAAWASLLVSLIGLPRPWVLTLDRTDWQLGKTPLNILVLGIVYKGVAIPVLWAILEKKGNSKTEERIAIVAEFVRLFGADSVLYLCADREFIGKTWFQWLIDNRIEFRIRIRENAQIANSRGELMAARRLFRGQALARKRFLYSIIAASELAFNKRYDEAIRELLRCLKRIRPPVKYKTDLSDIEKRAIAVKLMEYLVTYRSMLHAQSLMAAYNQVGGLLERLKPGLNLTTVKDGKFKECSASVPFKELALQIGLTEEVRQVRTIHSVKGAEFKVVIICLESEKDLSYVLDPNIEDEECRIVYVALRAYTRNQLEPETTSR